MTDIAAEAEDLPRPDLSDGQDPPRGHVRGLGNTALAGLP